MSKHCGGMHFLDPTLTLHVKRRGDYFVDDRANGANGHALKDHSNVLDQVRHDEQLNVHFYYKTRHRHKTIAEEPGELYIQETFTSNLVPVPRMEPSEAHESLGCLIAIDNNQEP